MAHAHVACSPEQSKGRTFAFEDLGPKHLSQSFRIFTVPLVNSADPGIILPLTLWITHVQQCNHYNVAYRYTS